MVYMTRVPLFQHVGRQLVSVPLVRPGVPGNVLLGRPRVRAIERCVPQLLVALFALPGGIELAAEHGERRADAARNPGNVLLGRPRVRAIERRVPDSLVVILPLPRGIELAGERGERGA